MERFASPDGADRMLRWQCDEIMNVIARQKDPSQNHLPVLLELDGDEPTVQQVGKRRRRNLKPADLHAVIARIDVDESVIVRLVEFRLPDEDCPVRPEGPVRRPDNGKQ